MKYTSLGGIKTVAVAGFAVVASVALIAQAPAYAVTTSANVTVNNQKLLDLQGDTQQQIGIIKNALDALKAIPQAAIQGGTDTVKQTLEQTMAALQTINATIQTATTSTSTGTSSSTSTSTGTGSSASASLNIQDLQAKLNAAINNPTSLTASMQVELERRLNLADAAKDALEQIKSLTGQQTAPVKAQLAKVTDQIKALQAQVKDIKTQLGSGNASTGSNASSGVSAELTKKINELVAQVNNSYSQFATTLGQSQLVTSAGSQQETLTQLTQLADQLKETIEKSAKDGANTANADQTQALKNQLANVEQLITSMSGVISSAIGLASTLSGQANFSQASTVFQSIFAQLSQNLTGLGSAQSSLQDVVKNLNIK